MANTKHHIGPLENPIKVLEQIIEASGESIIQTAFRYSYFLDPARVREKTPRFPGFARKSRKYYPGKNKGDVAEWKGRKVRIDDNTRAQMAWARYSGRDIERASGYGVRHIWGYPWDPEAYTAGWNLCYMPFWVGMLTEEQHPHLELQRAIQQAGYDLYFRDDPVCTLPPFVKDQGVDLPAILGELPIRILGKKNASVLKLPIPSVAASSPESAILGLRTRTNISWVALKKALDILNGKAASFNSEKVRERSKYLVRRMLRESGWGAKELRIFIQKKISAWESGV